MSKTITVYHRVHHEILSKWKADSDFTIPPNKEDEVIEPISVFEICEANPEVAISFIKSLKEAMSVFEKHVLKSDEHSNMKDYVVFPPASEDRTAFSVVLNVVEFRDRIPIEWNWQIKI